MLLPSLIGFEPLSIDRSSSGPSLKKFGWSFSLSVPGPGPRLAHHYTEPSWTCVLFALVRSSRVTSDCGIELSFKADTALCYLSKSVL